MSRDAALFADAWQLEGHFWALATILYTACSPFSERLPSSPIEEFDMIRKTALLSGIAGALMFAAPALAQEAPQDADAPATATQEAAQPQSLTLTPGTAVKSADGTELGKLVGVQNGASGQELTVRGADGSVRPVSVAGIKQQGTDIVVDATASDFQTAAPIAGAEPAPAAEPTPAEPTDEPTEEPAETPVDEPRT